MSQYRSIITANLNLIQTRLNELLSGKGLRPIEASLKRMNRGNEIPNWFIQLQNSQTLPNLDGKTIGSVIEKLLACVLEEYVFSSRLTLSINPAKGIDIPELELGIKSPSKNFCTSEPYFSAYERLIGNANDALILLTDYQSSKKLADRNHGLKLQILDAQYLRGPEIADRNLCEIAEQIKHLYQNDLDTVRRAIHFLAYINQGEWEASKLLELIKTTVIGHSTGEQEFAKINKEFNRKNDLNLKAGKDTLPPEALERLRIAASSPKDVILQAEGWVSRTLNENWHSPSQSVWNQIISRKLEGKIGMSFALQWRYNFSSIFRHH